MHIFYFLFFLFFLLFYFLFFIFLLHACANARVLLHRASELKFTCTEPMLIKFTNGKKQRFAYPVVLETEDACSADGSSPMVSLYLPSVLTLSAFPLRFSQRLLKPRRWWSGRPAVNWLLILGFLQGQKQWRKPIPLAVFLLDFSLLSVFFLCFVLCSVWFPSVPWISTSAVPPPLFARLHLPGFL